MPEASSVRPLLGRLGRIAIGLLVLGILWGLWETYRWTWIRLGWT